MCTKEAFRRARTLVSNLLCPLQLLSNSRLGHADLGILRRTGATPPFCRGLSHARTFPRIEVGFGDPGAMRWVRARRWMRFGAQNREPPGPHSRPLWDPGGRIGLAESRKGDFGDRRSVDQDRTTGRIIALGVWGSGTAFRGRTGRSRRLCVAARSAGWPRRSSRTRSGG